MVQGQGQLGRQIQRTQTTCKQAACYVAGPRPGCYCAGPSLSCRVFSLSSCGLVHGRSSRAPDGDIPEKQRRSKDEKTNKRRTSSIPLGSCVYSCRLILSSRNKKKIVERKKKERRNSVASALAWPRISQPAGAGTNSLIWSFLSCMSLLGFVSKPLIYIIKAVAAGPCPPARLDV